MEKVTGGNFYFYIADIPINIPRWILSDSIYAGGNGRKCNIDISKEKTSYYKRNSMLNFYICNISDFCDSKGDKL